jgi:hypothetical protein
MKKSWLMCRALYEIARYEVIVSLRGVAVEAAIHCDPAKQSGIGEGNL